MKKGLAVLAMLAAFPSAALAQKPVKRAETSEVTAKVEAIDHANRIMTLSMLGVVDGFTGRMLQLRLPRGDAP